MYKIYTKLWCWPEGYLIKFLRIMKITFVLMMAFLMQVSASTFAQKIRLNEKGASFETVLKKIRLQSGISYLVDARLFKQAKPVSIVAMDEELQDVLTRLFADQPFGFVLKENTIEFETKKFPAITNGFNKMINSFITISVRGQVVDENSLGLQGATVSAKKGKSAITGKNGYFTLEDVEEGSVLEISYVGYKTLIIAAKTDLGRQQLQPEDSRLDEITVQAYGKGSRRLATSNISKMNGDELIKQPVFDPIQALAGRIPGMVVSQSTGVPGARLNIQIRGRANFDRLLTSDQPLFVLDGVPLVAANDKVSQVSGPFGTGTTDGLSAFAGMNMADIESIDVLKDADATAIYGSRGANGVVLITTRKGKPGKMQMTANFYSGLSAVSSLPKMLNTEQYVAMRNEAFANDKLTKTNSNAYDLLLWDNNRYTDFADLLIGNTAPVNDAQVTFSGGNQFTQYRLGGGYHKEGSVWPGEMYSDRTSLSFNIHSMGNDEKFSIDLSGNYAANQSNLTALDLAGSVVLAPNFKLYDENGKLAWNEGGLYLQRDNPLALLNQEYLSQMSSLNANMVLNYRVINNLILRSSLGYSVLQNDEKRLTPLSAQNPMKPNLSGSASFANNQLRSWIIEPQAEYKIQISKGKLNVLIGITFNQRSTAAQVTNATGYTNDELIGSLKGAASTGITASNTATVYKYQAFFGRVNYNWNDKYIFNFTGRRDGSSRFGPNFRFSNFGAAGAAWIFSHEPVLSKNKMLSYGKLRASYGTTGNDQIGEYAYLDSWTTAGNYADSATLVPNKLYNPNLHWERNNKAEIGLELGFFKDRIFFTASVYQNISSDPLVNNLLPKTTGFAAIIDNLSGVKVCNRGLELTLSTQNISKKALKWSTDFNISFQKNKLTRFPNLEKSNYVNSYTLGQSLNRIIASQYLGVDPVSGLYVVKDVNGDNRINAANDYSVIGNTDPTFFGGLNNLLNYKKISLSFFFQFSRQLARDWRTVNTSNNPPGTIFNAPTLVLSRWQQENDITDVQKFTTSPGPVSGISGFNVIGSSSRGYTDAAYIRLKNISLSYAIPAKWINPVHISSCRFYVQAQNLFVITNYEGADPETQSYTRMAPLRSITAGLQLTL